MTRVRTADSVDEGENKGTQNYRNTFRGVIGEMEDMEDMDDHEDRNFS
jgi:hypothetical protein